MLLYYKKNLNMWALYILIFFQVFNLNKTSAAIAFTLYPTIIAAGLCIVSILQKSNIEVEKIKDFIPLILMVFFAIYSTITSDVVSWGNVATGFLIFSFVYIISTIQDNDSISVKNLLKFYSVLEIIISFWIIINWALGLHLLDGRSTISFLGVSKDQNYLSAFMLPAFTYILFSYFFGEERKRILLFCSIISFAAIYLTGSRAAFISALFVIMIVVMKLLFSDGFSTQKLLMMFGIVIATVIGYLILENTALFTRMGDVDSYTDNIRLTIWGYAMEGFYNHPMLGSGIQAGTYYAQEALRWYTHNCFVDMITGQGLIGVFLFVVIFVKFLSVNYGNRLFAIAMFASFFIPLFFINGYETLTFWTPMCIMKVISDSCKKDNFTEILWAGEESI